MDRDIAKLTSFLVSFAQQMLREHGEYYPFAATMADDGSLAQVAGDVGSDRPSSTALLRFLQEALRAQAEQGAFRATGICFNVGARLPGYADKVDAICCQLEHVEGRAVQIFVPFRKGSAGEFSFDRPVALPCEPFIFPTAAHGE